MDYSYFTCRHSYLSLEDMAFDHAYVYVCVSVCVCMCVYYVYSIYKFQVLALFKHLSQPQKLVLFREHAMSIHLMNWTYVLKRCGFCLDK